MADYKVTDTELASIANAIRTKGGTQAQLEFPTGFVSAVQAIPTGGGGGDLVLNDTQYKATTGGSFSYSKEITIEEDGNYKITCCSWGDNLNVKINEVSQSFTLTDSYFRLFYAEISLNANDTINMSTTGRGMCAAIFVVTKL